MSALLAHVHSCDSAIDSSAVGVSSQHAGAKPVPPELRSGTHSIPSPAQTQRRSDKPGRATADQRAQSLQRYLNAQTDIDDEVLQLYKLVCRL